MMKQQKNPHSARKTADKLNPLLPQKSAGQAPREEEKESLIVINGTILQKLSSLEELLKRSRQAGMPPAKDDKPVTFKEACAYLGYAPSYLYKLTYRKIIPHYKPTGKRIFFSKAELDEWIYRSNVKLRIENPPNGRRTSAELKDGNNVEKDPNQIEMELDVNSKNVKGETENVETEILIEFPLKSRRGK